MIDSKNRKNFELQGLEVVSFTVSHGSFYFADRNIDIQVEIKRQAIEWISEQRHELEVNNSASKKFENKMMCWTVVGAVAATIAMIASLIAILPIVWGH